MLGPRFLLLSLSAYRVLRPITVSGTDLLRDAPAFAARLGPLLACFTGEHVGEPRPLIALYGPPPVRVDLKFVADSQLDQRVEDGLILWQRDGALDAALRRAVPPWPQPDPQWIEDRFWVWIHYGATKLGRGELFECLDVLAALRAIVFGPLIARDGGHRAAGYGASSRSRPVWYWRWRWRPRSATTLRAAVLPRCARRSPSTASCAATSPHWSGRTSAEAASLDYLAQIESAGRSSGPGSKLA